MDGLRHLLEKPCKRAHIGELPEKSRLETLEEYVPLLKAVVAKIQAGELPDTTVSWTSMGSASKFFELPTLQQEYGMVLQLLASTLCQLAYQMLNKCTVTLRAEKDPAAHRDGIGQERAQQIVTLLRQAAGVLSYTEEELKLGKPKLKGDRPDELAPSMAAALRGLALAQAQAVVARRAQERSGPTHLVAALHNASLDFINQATEEFQGNINEYNTVPPAFLQYLALFSLVQKAQVHRVMGQESYVKEEAGFALAYLERARANMKGAQDSLKSYGKDAERRWSLEHAVAEVELLWSTYMKENNVVYFQPIPKRVPVLPAGKSMVSPISYEPHQLDDTNFLCSR
eukprot:CAMPEP_0196593228 /NCGR_PEP_ID=MMETSP1081-20130531/75082_1 /TAXON_ID=36882 /ORGANISM="Pyramimonas amylifera, Strain CCMP720" /LENGTH=342 /DNA_ID=CAMNT_0041917151 /DNA_START=156 /DNA_END=1184 /DNA_ORIENTATION=-